MKIVVTGAAGFIGSHLCRIFTEKREARSQSESMLLFVTS